MAKWDWRAKEPWENKKRMHELCLAMIIPWADGVPGFIYANMGGEQAVCEWLLDATENEKIPWEIE